MEHRTSTVMSLLRMTTSMMNKQNWMWNPSSTYSHMDSPTYEKANPSAMSMISNSGEERSKGEQRG